MCGIAGIFGTENLDAIRDMIGVQSHRGPDDQGVHIDEKSQVALGNVRLSILDLSPGGHMPMMGAEGRVWVTYNGEIYNFKAIREELQSSGYAFTSTSDTEVLLNAYLEWGYECLAHLRGMFAFAIFDSRKSVSKNGRGRLFLARDRLGIKPLYWTHPNGVFAFASELKALLASGLVSRRINMQAVWDYLSFGSVPLPQTILSDVFALMPGNFMVIQEDGIKIERYWDITEVPENYRKAKTCTSLVEAGKDLRYLLEEVVDLHLVSDVPVGAFLSGGVDSSALVALMSQRSSCPIKTFSVLFENEGSSLGELSWASMVAQQFGTDHTEVVVTYKQLADSFENIIGSIDQPSIDGVNTYFVSEATNRAVKVAISGLGSDEYFAGYGFFDCIAMADRIARGGIPFLAPLRGSKLLHLLFPRWRNEIDCIIATPLERYCSIRRLATEQEKRDMVRASAMNGRQIRPTSELFQQWLKPGLESIAQTTNIESQGYLVHTLLRDSDVMSMSHSLEVRVPFLDHELAGFAFSLAPKMKIIGADRKRVLIEAVKDLLPASIMARRKEGFIMPVGEWVAKPLRSVAIDCLNFPIARTLFSDQFLSALQSDIQSNRNTVGIWPFLILLSWIERSRCFL